MKVKINPITKEIEAEIDTQNDIALLKQLVKDNGGIAVKSPEPQLTESPAPKEDIFTVEPVEADRTEYPETSEQTMEEHGTPEQIKTSQEQNAYFARTPDLSNMQKFVMVNDIYEVMFSKKAPHNIVRADPNGYYQVRETMKALEKQGKLKHRRKKKTWLNIESTVPTEISEPVLHPPERPIMNGQLEKPKDDKGKKHPTAGWKPFSAEWFKETLLPKLPYKFGYNIAFKTTFHYNNMGKYDDATKSKYMKIYFTLNNLAKAGMIKREKVGNSVVFTKIGERPYTPDTETPKLIWSDIPIIKQIDLEDIFQNFQSITAPVFVGRISRYGKKIVPNEATVIMNFLIEHVSELKKLTGRKLRLTGFGEWKALEIG